MESADVREKGKSWGTLVKDAAKNFKADEAPQRAAAVAYYALFSLAPLLILAVVIAGFFFAQDAAREQMLGTAEEFAGAEGRGGLEAMLENASRPAAGLFAGLVSIVVLLWGASNVFNQLKKALNRIWEVKERDDLGWKEKAKGRLFQFVLVLGVGLLLLLSLVVGVVLSAAQTALSGVLPGLGLVWVGVQLVVSLALTTLVFAAVFKVLPNVEIGWRQVLLGAFITAVLFEIGRVLLGIYFATAGVGSAFGAAGSIAVVLVWLYYSGMIFFFGAELTQVLAGRQGAPVRPDEKAERLPSRAGGAGQRRRQPGGG